jgi:hypothetical protein
VKTHKLRHLIIFLFISLGSSCVSIDLPKNERVSASGTLKWRTPKNFSEMKDNTSDKTWIHNKGGALLSIISDCRKQADIPLKQALLNTNQVYDRLIENNESTVQIHQREALQMNTVGLIDGVKVHSEVTVAKINGCLITWTYTGLPKAYEMGLKDYQDYIKGDVF